MMTAHHPGLGVDVDYQLDPIPEDADGQVAAVVGMMRRYVERGLSHPAVQTQAANAATEGSGDPVDGVYRLVKQQMRFVRDEELAQPFQALMPDNPIVEVLVLPEAQAAAALGGKRLGDCDDYVMYAASLLLANGVPCSFVTVAANPRDLSRFSHVYLAAYPRDGRGRIPMDVSHGDYLGWETPNWKRKVEWPVGGESWERWAVIAAALGAAYVAYRKGWLN